MKIIFILDIRGFYTTMTGGINKVFSFISYNPLLIYTVEGYVSQTFNQFGF